MDRRTSLLGGRRSTDRSQWLDDLSNDLELPSQAVAGNELQGVGEYTPEKVGASMTPERLEYLSKQVKQALEEINQLKQTRQRKEILESVRGLLLTARVSGLLSTN